MHRHTHKMLHEDRVKDQLPIQAQKQQGFLEITRSQEKARKDFLKPSERAPHSQQFGFRLLTFRYGRKKHCSLQAFHCMVIHHINPEISLDHQKLIAKIKLSLLQEGENIIPTGFYYNFVGEDFIRFLLIFWPQAFAGWT